MPQALLDGESLSLFAWSCRKPGHFRDLAVSASQSMGSPEKNGAVRSGSFAALSLLMDWLTPLPLFR